MSPFFAIGAEGAEIVATGPVLTTANVALGPAAGARLPEESAPVPAAIEMPSVPPPVMPLIVTVRVAPEPVTAILPVALPLELSVMFDA